MGVHFNNKLWIWLFLIAIFIFRYFITRPNYKAGDYIKISSTILSDPQKLSTSQLVKIAGIRVYLPVFPEVSYGDKIIITGKVDKGILTGPKIINLEKQKSLLSPLRNKISDFYKVNLPQPMSGLLGGITIGAKGGMSADFYNKTKNIGLTHVVVASGTNITFVVSFLFSVLAYLLPRRKSIFFVILSILLYLFVAGFDAPLIRASIMSFTILLTQASGRVVNSWKILLGTCLLMLIYKPDWILDIGFILSFVSTTSLMLFEKRIRDYIHYVPAVFKEGLSTSISAQIGVSPILFVTFGHFNIWSPIANALVLWTVPIIMILGTVGGLIGLVLPLIGRIILYMSYPLLWWFVKVVEIFN